MIGFILAAGFGTRLQPVTLHLPKALVPVAGKPLLARSLQFLKNQGFSTIGVNSHYMSDQLEQFRKTSEIPFQIFHEEKIRGTGGALHFAKEFLSRDELFIVLNVDIVCNIDLAPAIEFFKKSPFSCLLVAFPPENGRGTVLYNEKNGDFIGTPKDCSDSSACSADFIGAALYKREFLSLLTEDDFSIIPVWSRAFQDGMRTGVFLMDNGYWRDIGTPKSLSQIHFDVIENVIDLDVPDYLYVNSNKKYCIPRSIDKQQYFQAENSWVETELIGNKSIIRHSVVFKNCKIDAETIVNNSLVTPWGVIDLE